MSDFMSHYVVPIAIGAVAVVLVLGLINMMRGGSPNTLAEADAAARAAAVRRHHRHHGDDLDDAQASGLLDGTARIYSSFLALALLVFFFTFFFACAIFLMVLARWNGAPVAAAGISRTAAAANDGNDAHETSPHWLRIAIG